MKWFSDGVIEDDSGGIHQLYPCKVCDSFQMCADCRAVVRETIDLDLGGGRQLEMDLEARQ